VGARVHLESLFVNQSIRRILVALLLAVVVYGGFVAFTGYRTLSSALENFTWSAFLVALGLSSFNYILRFFKWEFYLAQLGIKGIPKLDSFLIFLSGFVLTITPGKVGEVFKSAVLEEIHDIKLEKTAPIVVAERLTDVIAVVLLIVIGSLGFSGGLLWAAAGALAVTCGMVLIMWSPPAEFAFNYLSKGKGRVSAAVPQLRTAFSSLRILASPRALLIPTLLSLIGWGGEGLALHVLLGGFEEVIPLALALFFYATATLAGALIPVPGGLGIAETMIQSQLVELGGIGVGAATASMLMIRFATLWWAVIVGFVSLSLLKLRFPGLFSHSRGARKD